MSGLSDMQPVTPPDRAPGHFWPEGVPRQQTVPQQSLWANLQTAATRHPHKPAIVFNNTVTTYAELLAQTEQLAGWLQQNAGVRRGDRVLLLAQNSPAFSVAYYAVLRADAMVVPVNAMSTADDLAYLADNSGAAVAITDAALAGAALACPRLAQVLLIGEGEINDPRTTQWADAANSARSTLKATFSCVTGSNA